MFRKLVFAIAVLLTIDTVASAQVFIGPGYNYRYVYRTSPFGYLYRYEAYQTFGPTFVLRPTYFHYHYNYYNPYFVPWYAFRPNPFIVVPPAAPPLVFFNQVRPGVPTIEDEAFDRGFQQGFQRGLERGFDGGKGGQVVPPAPPKDARPPMAPDVPVLPVPKPPVEEPKIPPAK